MEVKFLERKVMGKDLSEKVQVREPWVDLAGVLTIYSKRGRALK